MDRVAFTRTMNKYGFEKICSQTVPGTFSEISHNSLLAEQVNNRASAQWKKAEFIFCSGRWKGPLTNCLRGWRLLAETTRDQYLIIQDENGYFKIFNAYCEELMVSLSEIIESLKNK